MTSTSALSQVSSLFAQNKKLMAMCLVAGLITGTALVTNAAYIVRDPENIAETVKVFTETSKVVTNTLEQLGVSKIDLENINKFLDKFNKATQEHTKNIEELMAKHGGYVGDGVLMGTPIVADPNDPNYSDGKKKSNYESADEFLTTFFPVLSGDGNGKMSLDAKNLAKIAYQGAVMSNNKQVLEAYREVQYELQKAHKELAELLEENAKLGLENKKGTLAAQQLNNQIKAVQARIESLQAMMNSIQGQNEIMRAQAKTQEEQNEIIYEQAQDKANKDYIKARQCELDATDKIQAPGLFSCF